MKTTINLARCLWMTALCLLSPFSFAQNCAPAAVTIQGRVEISPSGARSWKAARIDDALCAGQQIRVLRTSRAVLVLANQTLLHLDEGTVLALTSVHADKPSWVELLKGFLHVIGRVPQSLGIKTPYVNASVEGTELPKRFSFRWEISTPPLKPRAKLSNSIRGSRAPRACSALPISPVSRWTAPRPPSSAQWRSTPPIPCPGSASGWRGSATEISMPAPRRSRPPPHSIPITRSSAAISVRLTSSKSAADWLHRVRAGQAPRSEGPPPLALRRHPQTDHQPPGRGAPRAGRDKADGLRSNLCRASLIFSRLRLEGGH